MRIIIRRDDFTEVWDRVFYKKLSDWPHITDWEVRTLQEFIAYEASHGRSCTLECDDAALRAEIEQKLTDKRYLQTIRPEKLTECTACPLRKGCMTDLICHTTEPKNAASIFSSGKLLSAVRARGLSAAELVAEPRNAANDPEDFFHYVMLSWGNCQAGDRLVMERKLGRFPDEEDLSVHFTPGVRFYFRYDALAQHPNATFDGFLPMKIKDELILADWLHVMIIPEALRAELEPIIPENLRSRTLFIANDCKDIWDWSEKVYCAARAFSL